MAFAELALERPEVLFLFVGSEVDGGETRRTAERLGLARRVRFLRPLPGRSGRTPAPSATSALCLRRLLDERLTLAALLDLLRLGVPTIVSDVGTFSAYPNAAVRKAPWAGEDLSPLVRAMVEPASDADASRGDRPAPPSNTSVGPALRLVQRRVEVRGDHRADLRPHPLAPRLRRGPAGLGLPVSRRRSLGLPCASRHTVAGILTTRPFRSDKEERGVSVPRRRWIGTRRPSRPDDRSDRLIRRPSSGRPPRCPVISAVPRRDQS